MNKNETPHWAVNIIHTCMGLQRGEKILIVVDEPLSYAVMLSSLKPSKPNQKNYGVTHFQTRRAHSASIRPSY